MCIRDRYGAPGQTDNEGFDPYADSVGPGIYGGIVKRDENGNVMIGEQYQNHNPNPGPIYAFGGYTSTIKKLQSSDVNDIAAWFQKYPDLVNEITTGGATPLHMAGMSKRCERVTSMLIELGGDINAIDTYGFKPIHRMASNNLAIGMEALLKAGADPLSNTLSGETPMQIARSSRALDCMSVLIRYLK